MTTNTLAMTGGLPDLMAIFAAFSVGVALIYLTGLNQLPLLHDAAHDTRHALAFPCH